MISFDRIREIRKDKDLTQSDMAKYLDLKLYTYSKYEININIPSLETVYNISKLFYLDIDYVICLSDKKVKKDYPKYNAKLVAHNLRYLRESKGLTRQQLAMKLGVTQSSIHRYENMLCNPSLQVIYKYSKIFNISLNDLCTKKL